MRSKNEKQKIISSDVTDNVKSSRKTTWIVCGFAGNNCKNINLEDAVTNNEINQSGIMGLL